MTTSVTDATFSADIAQGLVLVDFWAEWCGPCQIMIPRLDELTAKLGDAAKICKLNVDENPFTAQSHKVMSIPTMILFKDGQAVERLVGVRSVDELTEIIKKHTAAKAE